MDEARLETVHLDLAAVQPHQAAATRTGISKIAVQMSSNTIHLGEFADRRCKPSRACTTCLLPFVFVQHNTLRSSEWALDFLVSHKGEEGAMESFWSRVLTSCRLPERHKMSQVITLWWVHSNSYCLEKSLVLNTANCNLSGLPDLP